MTATYRDCHNIVVMEPPEYNRILTECREYIAKELMFHQSSIERLTMIDARLCSLYACSESDDQETGISSKQQLIKRYTITAIVNGKKTHPKSLSGINEDVFDIILDLTTNRLRFRKDPSKRTKLIAWLEKVGPHRMRILAYMLEHPGNPFHADNIYKTYASSPEKNAPNTFTKTIGALRKALGQNDTTGPYIIKQFDFEGITGLKRGYVYQINTKWNYLVIRHSKEISV